MLRSSGGTWVSAFGLDIGHWECITVYLSVDFKSDSGVWSRASTTEDVDKIITVLPLTSINCILESQKGCAICIICQHQIELNRFAAYAMVHMLNWAW